MKSPMKRSEFLNSSILRRAVLGLVFLIACAAVTLAWFAPSQSAFSFLTGGEIQRPEQIAVAPVIDKSKTDKQTIARRVLQQPLRNGEKDSQDGVWREIQLSSLSGRVSEGVPETARSLALDKNALSKVLNSAPDDSTERVTNLAEVSSILQLPLPDGGFMRFRIVDSPVMEAGLVKKYPNIKSYRGQSIEDPRVSVRADFSPRGFNATILTADKMISIHPARYDDTNSYVSYYGDGFEAASLGCGVTESVMRQTADADSLNEEDAPNIATGATLKKYRLALAATQEYYNDPALGGGSMPNAVASLNTWVNAVNAIYERELAVRFLLVNNTSIIFTAEPDGLTNNTANTLLGEIRPILETNVGLTNYDVGHVLSNGNGGAGGVANLSVVCRTDNLKGGGVTQINSPSGNAFGLHVFAHELGHQFGAPHSWNSCPPASGQRSATSAYEVGSGSTIMSYGGACGVDNLVGTNYAANDKRFHAISLQNINSHLGTTSCAVTETTGNAAPIVDAGANYTIPKFTPFALTASATDADGDVPNLTYTWEQFDNGGALYPNPPYDDSGDPSTTTRPIFRAYAPSGSPTRYFPSLTYILNNANDPPDTADNGNTRIGEELPRVGRQMNFRVTARDNRSGGGGTNDDTVTLTVDGNSGPFNVTAPNTATTWTGGGTQTVTWDVNNTNAAPINAQNVKITLSTDGGNTFPIVLSATTPNDGSESITVPNAIQTATARLKVEAIGNVFFDISDANFTINNGDSCPIINGIAPGAGSVGTAVTITGVNFTGVTSVKFGGNVAQPTFTIVNSTTITTTVPSGASSGAITLSKPGCGDRQSAFFSVCTSSPQNLVIDDGSIEGYYGDTFFANRLTPPSYPATLTHVQIYWYSGTASPGQSITVLAGTNTDGDTDINNTAFQTVAATVNAQNSFQTYALPTPITITSGDFVIGYNLPTGGGAVDVTSPFDNRSYRSGNGVSFVPISGADLMLRAQYSTNCDAGATISPGAQSFNAAGGNGSIAVSTANAWTATTGNSWITINSGAGGMGNGTVVYSVAQNNTGAPRTGTITVAGQTFTITQDACAVGFAPLVNAAIDASGGNFSVSVAAPAGCSWTAATGDSWITINSGASGAGDGTISYSVPLNNVATARTGTITIAGKTFTVTQTACPSAPITMSVDEDTLTHVIGYYYVVNRLTPTSYPATLTHVQIYWYGGNATWIPDNAPITILAGKNTDGDANINGSIQQTFAASTGTARWDYTTYALPTPITISSGDFVVGFKVASTAASRPLSLEVNMPQRGRSYYSNNDGATFTNHPDADYKIRGQYQTYCQFGSISPSSRSFDGNSGSGTVSITALGAWSAFSNDSWITITGGGSSNRADNDVLNAPSTTVNGTGNGAINYSVAPNNSGAARSGTMTIAGQVFTVNQTLAPTAAGASISGRVLTSQGRSVSGATLTFTALDGSLRNTVPNCAAGFRIERRY
jgi:hypothetical protein